VLTVSLVEDESVLALPLWFALVRFVPLTRYLIVVHGASTRLS